jgi:hypothetical protein
VFLRVLQEEILEKALISSILSDAKIKIFQKYGKPKWQRPYRAMIMKPPKRPEWELKSCLKK